MIQFNLRVKPELKNRISASAVKNLRSDNSETIYRLQQSFELDLLAKIYNSPQTSIINTPVFDTTPRKLEIAERLSIVLSELSSSGEYSDMNIDEFAYHLGFETVSVIEMWFDARIEPSFEDLVRVAKVYGFNTNWLLWGKGYPREEMHD